MRTRATALFRLPVAAWISFCSAMLQLLSRQRHGLLRHVRVLLSNIDLEFGGQLTAEAVLWQHPFHSLPQYTIRVFLQLAPRSPRPHTTRITAMPAIDLGLH